MADDEDRKAVAKRPPPPEGRSIADEQRERSAENERKPIGWNDERSAEEKEPKQVEGLR